MTKRIEQLYITINELESLEETPEIKAQIESLRQIANKMEESLVAKYTAWDRIQIARMLERPRSRYYIDEIVEGFIELHGDRSFKDDQAIIGGIGRIGNYTVTIIAQNKGTNAKENIECNFGMPHPEGYRKALRLMKQAEKFGRPIICLIDTPGAYCGLEAEERGQGEAIAKNLLEMSRLRVPVISGVIGEGGSGGALALAVADKVFMQENTTYSILSPEGFSSILWKDSNRAEEAASIMKITPKDLLYYEIIDDIVSEPLGGAHKNPSLAAKLLKEYLIKQLDELTSQDIGQLTASRYDRFRKYGEFSVL